MIRLGLGLGLIRPRPGGPGGGGPGGGSAFAILDETGDPILDENGDAILDEGAANTVSPNAILIAGEPMTYGGEAYTFGAP